MKGAELLGAWEHPPVVGTEASFLVSGRNLLELQMVVVTVRQVTSPLDCIRVEDPPLPMDPEPVPAGLERSHQPGGSLPAPPTHTASNTHRPAPAPTTCTLAPTGVYKLEVQAWEG